MFALFLYKWEAAPQGPADDMSGWNVFHDISGLRQSIPPGGRWGWLEWPLDPNPESVVEAGTGEGVGGLGMLPTPAWLGASSSSLALEAGGSLFPGDSEALGAHIRWAGSGFSSLICGNLMSNTGGMAKCLASGQAHSRSSEHHSCKNYFYLFIFYNHSYKGSLNGTYLLSP